MRTVACVLLCAALALAQNNRVGLPEGKAVQADFTNLWETITKTNHVHVLPLDCKGKPDGVYGRMGNTYYGCMKEKEVCTDEKNVIPLSYVEAYQQRVRKSAASSAAVREKVRQDVERASRERVSNLAPSPSTPTVTVSVVSNADLARADARPPISLELLRSVAIGASRAEVIQKLGPPRMKLTGDVEYYTYVLESGNSAQVELDNGKLARVDIVRMQ